MRSGLLDAVLHAAAHKPLFGVCVGMQMLLDHSQEGTRLASGLIPGDVVKFELPAASSPMAAVTKCPRWAGTRSTTPPASVCRESHPVWAGVPDGSYFYFVHSYYAHRLMRATAWVKPTTAHAFPAIARDNIFATQFHPEKSADHGLQLYRNFLHWNP
jgi:glutamine amidotransferase